MHDYDLIMTLAACLSSALVGGFLTHRLGLSPIVGYLLAGIAVGPYTPGFVAEKIEGKIAFRIVENAEITLADVRVPEANRLQRINSFRDVAEILRATRGGVAWQALGVMIGAYELALAYAQERKQFGRPIARFQMVQDLLVKSLGNITSLKEPPAFPKGWDPKVIKVWVPKFDEFEKLRAAWLDDWNKTYGYRQ